MRYFKHIILLLLFPVLLLSQNDWSNQIAFSSNQTPILAIGDTNILVSKIYSRSTDGINWYEAASESFDYNKYGSLISHSHTGDPIIYGSPVLQGEGFFSRQDTLLYDQYNRLIEEHILEDYAYFYISKNEYYDDNKIKKRSLSGYHEGDPNLDLYFVNYYFYDKDSLSYVYNYSSDSLNAEPWSRDYYTYIGKIQKDIYRQYKVNGVWKDTAQETFKYSPTGKLIYNSSIDNQYVERIYEYDPITDLLLSYQYYSNKILLGHDEYIYNIKGQLIFYETFSPSGHYKEDYFYTNDTLKFINRSTAYYDYLGFQTWDDTYINFNYNNGIKIQKVMTYHFRKNWSDDKYGKIDYQYRIINGVDDEKTENTLISVSPNPATDFIEISVGTRRAVSEQSEIKIYDILGQIVSTPVCSADTPASGGQRIDVSGLVSGMYFVRIGDKVMKFVKL
jgi:hypothetical protein